MAFLDYGDESSMVRSKVSLGLYGGEKGSADKLSKKSFAKRVVSTAYQARVGGRYGSNSNCRYGY